MSFNQKALVFYGKSIQTDHRVRIRHRKYLPIELDECESDGEERQHEGKAESVSFDDDGIKAARLTHDFDHIVHDHRQANDHRLTHFQSVDARVNVYGVRAKYWQGRG